LSGLDVPMDNPLTVRIAQRIGHLARNLERLVQRKLFLPVQPVPERLALHIRHEVVEKPVGFTGVVEGQDVGVMEPCRDFDLPKKSLRAKGLGEVGLEDFDGDGAAVLQIFGEVDRGHAAPTEFTVEVVTLGQRELKAASPIGHQSVCRRSSVA
jgi:hypothetical protein